MTPETYTIRNAKITSTNLGVKHTDHGILSFYIMLDYGGASQGFGGIVLDTVNPAYPTGHTGPPAPIRVPTTLAASLLLGIYEVFEVDWEELPGLPCRAYGDWGTVRAIGHYLEDKWLWCDGKIFKVTNCEGIPPENAVVTSGKKVLHGNEQKRRAERRGTDRDVGGMG